MALAIPFVLSAQVTELHLASDIWPPFTNDGQENAFAQMLVEEALRRSDVDVRTSITDFNAVIKGLKDQTYDGSAALWHSEERAAFLTYSDPYLENRLVLIGKKGTDVSAASLDELAGKKIGIVGDYEYGEDLIFSSNTAPIFIPGGSDQDNLSKLLGDEIDYMLVDDLLIQYVLTHQGEEAKMYIEVGTNAMLVRALHFAVRKDLEGGDELIKRSELLGTTNMEKI